MKNPYIIRKTHVLHLNKDELVTTLANRILREIRKVTRLQGRKPSALKAGAYYISSLMLGKHVTQDDVSITFGVSNAAVRQARNLILEHRFLEKIGVAKEISGLYVQKSRPAIEKVLR